MNCGRCNLGGTPNCKVHTWTDELIFLRKIVTGFDLNEDSKWGVPCYTLKGKNVLMISAFKNYCCISFFKGALLKDTKNLLVKPGPNSQAARLLKFTALSEIENIEDEIKGYIHQSIEIEKAGLKVKFESNPEKRPKELEARFENDPQFKTAFESLTPGRQRGYILYFSQPKQTKTVESRIDKCTPMILSGIGLHDKYSS